MEIRSHSIKESIMFARSIKLGTISNVELSFIFQISFYSVLLHCCPSTGIKTKMAAFLEIQGQQCYILEYITVIRNFWRRKLNNADIGLSFNISIPCHPCGLLSIFILFHLLFIPLFPKLMVLEELDRSHQVSDRIKINALYFVASFGDWFPNSFHNTFSMTIHIVQCLITRVE